MYVVKKVKNINIINKYLKSAEQQKTPDKQAVDEIKKDAGDLQEKIQDMKEKGLYQFVFPFPVPCDKP